MKNNNLKVFIQNAVLASIYIILTLINPIGWGMIQFRFSEMLAVIPFLNRRYIPALIIGVLIANYFSPLGIIDMFFGVLCALISYSISYFVKNIWINALQYAIVCGIVIGLELTIVAKSPFLLNFISIIIGTSVSTFIGTYIFNKSIFQKYILKS